MNVLGIITEYNPMHNGHIYHIEEAKKITKADYVICVMSGSFTQQGNISVINKFKRAEIAIQNGIDLVIELPTVYATSSSEDFAKGAVNILNSLGIVTHIAFGSECKDITLLENIASKIVENEEYIHSQTSQNMQQGISAPNARDLVYKEILTDEEYLETSKPNNILGIEYITSLLRLKSKIKPVCIPRLNSCHSDTKTDNSSVFASSTAIRNELALNKNCLENIQNFVPFSTLEMLKNSNIKLNENFFLLLKYKILILGKEEIKNIREVSEGLENRIISCIKDCNTYEDFIQSLKCKRYTLGRIKRICINILLGITKDLDYTDIYYARVLKISNKSINLLSLLENSSIDIITSLNENKLNKLDKSILELLNLDILATNIREIDGNINLDYTNNIIYINENAGK